ncbi:hypothetical protein BH10BAC4_BH10BAC4_20560 [soil metagenome]
MNRLLIRYSLLSLCVLIHGCTSDYQFLKSVRVDNGCGRVTSPTWVGTSWYHTSVDVTGKHLSGLVLIKNMPDSSRRIVFTSEAGVTFFDFGFDQNGRFSVHSIIKKLDKKPIINTLEKDFALITGIPFKSGDVQAWSMGNEIYFGVQQKKETAYFITNKDCSSLRRLELGTKMKRKISVRIARNGYPLPDSLDINHYTFPLRIQLIRFEKE